MSTIKTNGIMGPELTGMKIRMKDTAHLNVIGTLKTSHGGQICLPSGTTDERPSSPQKGMIRINETKLGIEVYDEVDEAYNEMDEQEKFVLNVPNEGGDEEVVDTEVADIGG